MDPQRQIGVDTTGKGTKKRRFWVQKEEIASIVVAKDLVKQGYRQGNGWKGGFFAKVEEEMKKLIPGCTIESSHVLSKFTVWKKEYVMVSDVTNLSGVSWDHGSNMILVDSDDVWDNLQKNGVDVEKLRKKSFPYFEDWCEIFGKDRATGQHACDYTTNERNTTQSSKNGATRVTGKTKFSDFENNFSNYCNIPSEEDDVASTDKESPKSADACGGTSKKSKPNTTIVEDPFTTMVEGFMLDTGKSLASLSKSVDKLCDGDPNPAKAMTALKNICGLTQAQRLDVAQKLVEKPSWLQLFVSMDVDDQIGYVKMMLGD